MIYIPSAQVILEEDEDELEYTINVPNPSTRSHTRRERIPGLGIDNLDDDVPFATFSSTPLILNDDNGTHGNSSRPLPRRSMSGRRSITSLLSKKSLDAQTFRHRHNTPTSARASRISNSAPGSSSSSHFYSHSQSNHAIPPATISYSPPRPSSLYLATPHAQPAQFPPPNPSASTISDSGSSTAAEDDITTYHANLARFKAERAERAAELGVDGFDAERQPYFAYHTRVGDMSSLKIPKPSTKVVEERKGSGVGLGMGLGRGLRAYWGGGSSSSDARRLSTSTNGSVTGSRPSSRNSSLIYDEAMDRQALKEWWDQLGEEPGMKY